mgnify:CR=1 FL=1
MTGFETRRGAPGAGADRESVDDQSFCILWRRDEG